MSGGDVNLNFKIFLKKLGEIRVVFLLIRSLKEVREQLAKA